MGWPDFTVSRLQLHRAGYDEVDFCETCTKAKWNSVGKNLHPSIYYLYPLSVRVLYVRARYLSQLVRGLDQRSWG